MDARRFDTLIQSLSTAGSRRRALVAAFVGALGLFGWQGIDHAAAHDPSKACKKKSGKAKKKCLKKAKAHNATHTAQCTPSCAGKECGSDGCGASCGPCTGGVCDAGACTCPSTAVLCKGDCVNPCGNGSTALDPATCRCCGLNYRTSNCSSNSQCCSGDCRQVDNDDPPTCAPRSLGASCEFNEQCLYNCANRVCGCPSGWVRWPGSERCCITNGANSCAYEEFSFSCCSQVSGPSACTGPNRTCAGRARGEACEFPAQCHTNTCTDGVCGCPVNTQLCGGECHPACAVGQAHNPNTCVCEDMANE